MVIFPNDFHFKKGLLKALFTFDYQVIERFNEHKFQS